MVYELIIKFRFNYFLVNFQPQLTHLRTSGISNILLKLIGFLHFIQIPKSELFILDILIFRFCNFSSEFLSILSLILLLLIASILLILPIEFSGSIGFANWRSSSISIVKLFIFLEIIF